jgi:hypothetical protein
VVIWYIFSRFGILYQERSGNPAVNLSLSLSCHSGLACKNRRKERRAGVNVMITFFRHFRQFSAKKLAFSSKTNVIIKILPIVAEVLAKTPIFGEQKMAKIFLNRNLEI